MLKNTLRNSALRKRARQFGNLVRRSAVTPRTGQMGLTFIGHSGFFVQLGGQNVVIDPNFARWLFVLKRLRQPGLHVRDLPAIDLVLVTHAHFDHLHRPSLRAIVQNIVMARAMGPGDVMVNMRPLWPIAAIIVLAHLSAGGAVVLGGRFEPARLVSLLREYRAAATSMVPCE